MILFEWMIALVKISLEPIYLISPTILVVILVLFSLWKISEIYKEVQHYKLGRNGERAVAEILENLVHCTGCYVYHDIVAEINKVKLNINHIVVSVYGLFVVETKTRTKPARGETKIDFDGDNIKLTGHPVDSNPVQQTRMNLQWLRDKIRSDIIGRPFDIRGIVVYPGWWIDSKQMRTDKDVWISNVKYLEYAITQMQPIFTPEEVKTLNNKIKEIPGTTSQIIE